MASRHLFARTFGAAVIFALLVSPTVPADGLYFPKGNSDWARVDPSGAGWNLEALDAALDYARAAHSSSVVILLNGRILAEREWDVDGPARYARMRVGKTSDGRVIEDVASAQKSLVARSCGSGAGSRQAGSEGDGRQISRPRLVESGPR